MNYHITMDSFGDYCPQNWQEIADYINNIIDSRITPDEFGDITADDRETIDAIWENYCNGDRGSNNAPDPIWG